MAGANLLTLIDDIATLLDDVSVMTKVAARKTTGLLGDDLALNAEQVTGVRADRELPVVWAVAKGSLLNKMMLIPAALLISALLPWLVTVLLMLGGTFLCFEGAEKLAGKFLHGEDDKAQQAERVKALASGDVDMPTFERNKIKGAVRTDFILSAEIIVIALGTITGATLTEQIIVLIGIGLLMTVGVYGVVAGIVKLDDLGVYLNERGGSLAGVGRGLIKGTPYLMKLLSVVGTLAMFLVGGGILSHGVPALHHLGQHMSDVELAMPGLDAIVHGLGPMLLNLVIGVVVGVLVLGVVTLFKKWRGAAT